MRSILATVLALILVAAPSLTRAQEQCPPCECTLNAPEADQSQMLGGSESITVGTGDDVYPLVQGPVVLTSFTIDCAARLVLVYPDGREAIVMLPLGRLFIPDGARLEVRSGIGFCRGTVAWSGYRPS